MLYRTILHLYLILCFVPRKNIGRKAAGNVPGVVPQKKCFVCLFSDRAD